MPAREVSKQMHRRNWREASKVSKGFGDQTQVTRFGGKCIYSLNHLPGPLLVRVRKFLENFWMLYL